MAAETEWRGQPDTSWRRLLGWLVLSLVLHAPLSPLVALLGLLGFVTPPEEAPAAPPITAIPVDLLEDDTPAGAREAPPEQAAKSAEARSEDLSLREVEPEAPKRKPKREEPKETAELDAGAEEPTDAAPSDLDAQADPADGGAPGPGVSIGDPVAMSGAAGRIADANANVRLLVHTDRIRNHPLGPRIGQLLGSVYQWRDFFGPTGLDPVRDIDRILIAGPQLRDSSAVVAVLQHNVGEEKMRRAVDLLVQRSAGGGWLDAGVPAATAQADRAERIFVLPTKDIVIVSPPSAAEHAMKHGAKLRFRPPKGPEVVTAYVVTPWRVFLGLPFSLPKSIKWAKLALVPQPGGGAVVHIEAEDESAEAASANAEQLERAARAATQVQLGVLGALLGTQQHRFIDEVTFNAKGAMIHGRATANARQLASALEMASAYMRQQAERAARRNTPSGGARPAAPDAGSQ